MHRLRDYWRSRKYRPAATGGSTWAEQLAEESSNASREWNLAQDRQVMARLLESVRPRFEVKTWEAFHRQMFDGQRADVVAAELGMPLNSVYVARSRVLDAMRLGSDLARSAIRISLGWSTHEADVERFIAAWSSVTARHATRRVA